MCFGNKDISTCGDIRTAKIAGLKIQWHYIDRGRCSIVGECVLRSTIKPKITIYSKTTKIAIKVQVPRSYH